MLAKLQAMVEQMKESVLELQYYTMKYDIPFTRAINDVAAEQREQLGTIVEDKSGL